MPGSPAGTGGYDAADRRATSLWLGPRTTGQALQTARTGFEYLRSLKI